MAAPEEKGEVVHATEKRSVVQTTPRLQKSLLPPIEEITTAAAKKESTKGWAAPVGIARASEVRAYLELGFTPKEISEALGINRTFVDNVAKLLKRRAAGVGRAPS